MRLPALARLLLPALLVFTRTGAAAGFTAVQEPPGVEDRALLERVALGRARSDLTRTVYALPLKAGLTIRTWAGRDPRLDRELRLWLRGLPRTGPARFYSDGSCDVDVQLESAVLREKLLELHKRFALPVTSDEDVSRSGHDWPLLWGGGSASAGERVEAKPPGWEDVSLEGVEVARRAAEADSLAALLEEAGRLRLTAARSLREFMDSSDAVRAALTSALERNAKVRVTHGADQVCVAEAQIETVELLRILNDVFSTTYKGSEFQASDFREMVIAAPRGAVIGTGLATPPEKHRLRASYPLIELDAPSWVEKKIETTARLDRSDSVEIDASAAVERARLIAVDQLRLMILELAIRDGLSVGNFLSYRPSLKDDVTVFLSGARVVSVVRGENDDSITVRVELHLRRLWEIVKRGLTPVETDPGTATSNDPPEGRG